MNVIKNYIFNMGYQILIIGSSLILSPYLSRVIGAEGIGIYSYTYSISILFGIAANLGIAKYGNREIAMCGDDRKKRSEVFAQILFIKLLCAMVVLTGYSIFVHSMIHEYKEAFWIQIFLVLSYVVDVTWLFWGMQQFQVTTAVCTVIKVLSIAAILTLVRERKDTNLYIFLMAFSSFLVQLIPWFFLPKFVDLKISAKHAWKKHGKSIVLLFFPILAKQIYGIMDIVALQIFTDIEQVGYYQNVGGIATTILCVICALGDVVMPKITLYFHENRLREAMKVFQFSFHLISFLGVGSMYGLIGIADVFIPFFYGKNFMVCIGLLQLIAPYVLLVGYSGLIRNSLLLPNYQDREYMIALMAGVTVNFFGNFILIYFMGTSGAIIASVISELVSLLIQTYFAREHLPFLYCIKKGIVYLLLGLPIFIVCRGVKLFDFSYAVTTILDIVLGGTLYVIGVMIYLKKREPEIYQYGMKYLRRK